MFCSKCGEVIVPDAKFCVKCGGSIEIPVQAVTTPTPPPLATETSSASTKVRPWVRYWARMFDIYSFSFVVGLLLGVISPEFLTKQNDYVLGIILAFVWIFVEAWMLSSFHTTPGKWFFKTNLALSSGANISYSKALSRSFKVWLRGFGIGFPLASMITMGIAHGRLTRTGITSWDEEEGFLVTHKIIGTKRVLALIAFFFVMICLVYIGSLAKS